MYWLLSGGFAGNLQNPIEELQALNYEVSRG